MSTPANDGTQPRGIPTEGTPTEYDPTVPEVDTSDITVTMNVPAAGPASLGFPQKLTSTRAVVSE